MVRAKAFIRCKPGFLETRCTSKCVQGSQLNLDMKLLKLHVDMCLSGTVTVNLVFDIVVMSNKIVKAACS